MILIIWVIVVFERLGEFIQNKFRVGFARMERIIKDRMSTLDINTLTPNQLINARPLLEQLRNFLCLLSFLSLWIKQIL